jgi:cytochrome c553
MSRELLSTIVLVSALHLFAAAALAQSPDLPQSDVKDKVAKACTACHNADIIVQQRLSKAAWGKELDKMTKWGAAVEASDRDAVVDYLSVNFSPDKPAALSPRSAPAGN